jgi:hypothetical protein
MIEIFKPYLGGLLNIGTDFNSINFAYGVSSGFEFCLPWFDGFIEADMYISNKFGTAPVSLAAGVRL